MGKLRIPWSFRPRNRDTTKHTLPEATHANLNPAMSPHACCSCAYLRPNRPCEYGGLLAGFAVNLQADITVEQHKTSSRPRHEVILPLLPPSRPNCLPKACPRPQANVACLAAVLVLLGRPARGLHRTAASHPAKTMAGGKRL